MKLIISERKARQVFREVKNKIEVDGTGRGVFFGNNKPEFSINVETDVDKEKRCLLMGWRIEKWHSEHEKGAELLAGLINYALIENRIAKKRAAALMRAEVRRAKKMKHMLQEKKTVDQK